MSSYNNISKDIGDYIVFVIVFYCLYLIFLTYPSVMVSISIIDTLKDNPGNSPISLILLWGVISTIQFLLIKNIRKCWGILAFWYIISLYPFIKFLVWMGDPADPPFPGIDWMIW